MIENQCEGRIAVDFKGIIAAAASVALMATPTIAGAQRAAPRAATTEVAPASENANGSELHGGFVIPLIAIAAIVLIIILATRHHHNNLPTSP
jgi:acyl-CoA hydrolase